MLEKLLYKFILGSVCVKYLFYAKVFSLYIFPCFFTKKYLINFTEYCYPSLNLINLLKNIFNSWNFINNNLRTIIFNHYFYLIIIIISLPRHLLLSLWLFYHHFFYHNCYFTSQPPQLPLKNILCKKNVFYIFIMPRMFIKKIIITYNYI